MAEITSGIYKITNAITGDFYIGSSKNIKRRWKEHKKPSVWKNNPNNPMYLDMQKYGVDKFELQILEEVEPESLKEIEQQFIEKLQPAYNSNNAKVLNIEKVREYQIEYYQQNREKRIEYQIEYYQQNIEKVREYQKEYQKSDKFKEYQKEFYKEYNNQTCCYNGEVLTLCALSKRFQRTGIDHPQIEAKKYLVL